MFGLGTLGSRLDLNVIAYWIPHRQKFQHIAGDILPRSGRQKMSQLSQCARAAQAARQQAQDLISNLCRFASESIWCVRASGSPPQLCILSAELLLSRGRATEGTSRNSAPETEAGSRSEGILQWRSLRSPRSACSRSRTCATRRSCTVHAPGWTKRLSSTTSRSLRLHGSSG